MKNETVPGCPFTFKGKIPWKSFRYSFTPIQIKKIDPEED